MFRLSFLVAAGWCVAKCFAEQNVTTVANSAEASVDQLIPWLLNEDRHLHWRALATNAVPLPHRRFRNARATVNYQKRRQRAGDKQSAPAKMWKDDPVNQRRKQIPDCIALL